MADTRDVAERALESVERQERDLTLQVGTFAAPEHRAYFQQFKRIRLPSMVVAMLITIVPALALVVAFLVFTPWVQTSHGAGIITALDPADRTQSITALTGGRIAQWFVRDGSTVRRGDPIVEILDLDPQLVERLEAGRAAAESQYQSARAAKDTARLNYERQARLEKQGLVSRADVEQAKIRVDQLEASESAALASLAEFDINLTRQSVRTVVAPRDGTIVRIEAGDSATLVDPGQVLASFVPSGVALAAEIYITGLDASIVEENRNVRLRFEGWPAVQFAGWPEQAIGTFGGIVQSIDPVASTNGRFRVLVTEDPDDPWPETRFLRMGARAEGWILLSEVTLGYELWRRLNSFPPQQPGATPASSPAAAGNTG